MYGLFGTRQMIPECTFAAFYVMFTPYMLGFQFPRTLVFDVFQLEYQRIDTYSTFDDAMPGCEFNGADNVFDMLCVKVIGRDLELSLRKVIPHDFNECGSS